MADEVLNIFPRMKKVWMYNVGSGLPNHPDGPMHKRLKSLSDDDEMDIDDIYPRILCQEEKILVPLHTIQQIAFKLNKATDAEVS